MVVVVVEVVLVELVVSCSSSSHLYDIHWQRHQYHHLDHHELDHQNSIHYAINISSVATNSQGSVTVVTYLQ